MAISMPKLCKKGYVKKKIAKLNNVDIARICGIELLMCGFIYSPSYFSFEGSDY
jgi:hypothetical protein